MNAADIIEALRRHHQPTKGWVTVTEVRVATGFYGAVRVDNEILNREQRIDFYALQTWPSKKYERIAYEIKISRADLLKELREPCKRHAAELLANRFVFACPTGLMRRSELPEDCGLIEVRPDGSVYTFRQGTWRDRPEPPLAFVASMMRNASKQRPTDRCGANGCHRPAYSWQYSAPQAKGVRVPLCLSHLDTWTEADPRQAEARREIAELARQIQEPA